MTAPHSTDPIVDLDARLREDFRKQSEAASKAIHDIALAGIATSLATAIVGEKANMLERLAHISLWFTVPLALCVIAIAADATQYFVNSQSTRRVIDEIRPYVLSAKQGKPPEVGVEVSIPDIARLGRIMFILKAWCTGIAWLLLITAVTPLLVRTP